MACGGGGLCGSLWLSVRSVFLFACTEDTEVAQRDTEEWVAAERISR
jgi:hypothetical protein